MTPDIKMPDIPAPEGGWGEWEVDAELGEDGWREWSSDSECRVKCLYLVARRKGKKPVVKGLLCTSTSGDRATFFSRTPFVLVGLNRFDTVVDFWKDSEMIPKAEWPAPGRCCEYTLVVDAVAGGEDG